MAIDGAAAAAAAAARAAEQRRQAELARERARAAAAAKAKAAAAAAAAKAKAAAAAKAKAKPKLEERPKVDQLKNKATALARAMRVKEKEKPADLSPAERRTAASKRIEAAKELPPKEQAEEVKKAVTLVKSPAERAQLLRSHQPQLDALSEKVFDRDVSDDDRKAMTSLAETAQLAGPEGRKVVAASVAAALPKERDTNGLSDLREVSAAFSDASVEAGGTGLMRATAEQLRSTDKIGAVYLYDHAAGATKKAQEIFKDKQQNVDQLNGKLSNYLKAAGPSLSPEDREKMIARFKERHEDEYAELEEAGENYGGFVRERKEVLASTDPKDPVAAPLRAEQKTLLDSFDTYAQTKDGQELLRADLAAKADGKETVVIDELDLSKKSPEFVQGVQAGLLQAVTRDAMTGVRNGDFSAAGKLLTGLRQVPNLLGVAKDSDRFQKVMGNLQGMLESKRPPTPATMQQLSRDIDAVGGSPSSSQVLKSFGLALGVAKLAVDISNFDEKQLQGKVTALADAVGLSAQGGSLALNAIGKEATTLGKALGFTSKAAGAVGAIFSGITAVDAFQKGKVVDGLLSSGVAAASLAALAWPGPGTLVAGVLSAAQVVKGVIDFNKAKGESRDELRDLLDETELKNLQPELLEHLLSDAPKFDHFAHANALAKETGTPPREMLNVLAALPEDERNWALDHTDDVKAVLAHSELFGNTPRKVFDHLVGLPAEQRELFLETTRNYDQNSNRKGLEDFDRIHDQIVSQYREVGADELHEIADEKRFDESLSPLEREVWGTIHASTVIDPRNAVPDRKRELDHLAVHGGPAHVHLLRSQGILPPQKPYTGPH